LIIYQLVGDPIFLTLLILFVIIPPLFLAILIKYNPDFAGSYLGYFAWLFLYAVLVFGMAIQLAAKYHMTQTLLDQLKKPIIWMEIFAEFSLTNVVLCGKCLYIYIACI
jgi:hypothetical protein